MEIYVAPSTEYVYFFVDFIKELMVNLKFNYFRANYNSTTTFPGDVGSSGGGMDPFQIVLIVVCVALAIGLIVALVVLLYYGRLVNHTQTNELNNDSNHSLPIVILGFV